MGANNITQTLELAVQAYLVSKGIDTLINVGLTKSEDAPQIIKVVCQDATNEEPYDGNWQCRLRVEVESNCDDYTEAEHKDAAAEVYESFFSATVADDLSAAYASFAAQEVIPTKQGYMLQDRKWVSYLEVDVNCCGSDLT